MPCFAAVCQLIGHRALRGRGAARARCSRSLLLRWLLAGLAALAALMAQAQGVDVVDLRAVRDEQAIRLDYQLRVTLPRVVEEAMLRGVPLYFKVRAMLWKLCWYWRDERVACAIRFWRLSFQPLTSNWRVSQGGLGQSHASLAEALATMTRNAGWKIAEARDAEADGRQYVEFNWWLDTEQLPRPMQIGLSGVGGASDWALGVERSVKLEAAKR